MHSRAALTRSVLLESHQLKLLNVFCCVLCAAAPAAQGARADHAQGDGLDPGRSRPDREGPRRDGPARCRDDGTGRERYNARALSVPCHNAPQLPPPSRFLARLHALACLATCLCGTPPCTRTVIEIAAFLRRRSAPRATRTSQMRRPTPSCPRRRPTRSSKRQQN
eukprot:1524341-Pleurochrysis_carterae.AAC.1